MVRARVCGKGSDDGEGLGRQREGLGGGWQADEVRSGSRRGEGQVVSSMPHLLFKLSCSITGAKLLSKLRL